MSVMMPTCGRNCPWKKHGNYTPWLAELERCLERALLEVLQEIGQSAFQALGSENEPVMSRREQCCLRLHQG